MTLRIAMWSGPRNLSTAMMYSFAQRDDTVVTDEPFYAAYLAATGLDHPMRDEVMRSQSGNANAVAQHLSGQIPNGKSIWYQKHMTHHMLPNFDLSWAMSCQNVFLIRHPARVVASYVDKRDRPTAADLGFQRQFEIWRYLKNQGERVLVVNSDDVTRDPKQTLTRLCGELDISFQQQMLSWQRGGIPEDGVWAPHWYGAIHASSGFTRSAKPLPNLTGQLGALVDQALPYYGALLEGGV